MSWPNLNFWKVMLFASGQSDFRAGILGRVRGSCLRAQRGGLHLECTKGSRES